MKEVEGVVRQKVECKAPSLDGFTINSFHFFWDMVKE